MGVIKRTINVEEQITGGARCASPKIEWDDPLCAGIICTKNDGRTIDVSIPDDCTERCFWVTYTCNDFCQGCDPIRLKICPCDVDADCEACSKCDPVYNVCVSICDADEFCTDFGTCVECDATHPCKNGKQCVGGQCECPPDKPFLVRGECMPCTDDSCPPGQVCTPDGCVDPVCPEGHWNVAKKKCVQCNNTGDCDPGECCQGDNTCACCDGFVRDPVTRQCVSAPCSEDKDCPECFFCKTGVGCVPVVCPDGKVCIPGMGCVPECNCNNPNCTSQSSACVSYSPTVCYCKDCTGSCANGEPCGEGCFCDDDGMCKPNPCSNVTCTDGTECGNGCGCNERTHKCEPCSKAECGDECDNLLGCDCPNGTSCQDVNGCSGPCDGYGGCPLGCTCDNGVCVACADFSCKTNDCASHPECICTSTGCEGNPDFCKDTFKDTEFNCGLTAELALKSGCMCPGITAYAVPHIAKGLLPVGSTEKTYLISLALRLAKGVANSWDEIKQLHLLDETQYEDIADNDKPTSGTLDLTISEFYQPQAWVSGTWVNQGSVVSRVLPPSGSISFAGIARKENIKFTANKPGTGKNIIVGVSQEKIVRYEVGVKANSLKFPNNCTYEAKTLPTLVLDSGVFKSVTDSLDALSGQYSYIDLFIAMPNGNYNLGGKFLTFTRLHSDSKRDPLFTWFRSEDNVYDAADIIRKLYITPDAPGVYRDTLFGPKKFALTKQNLVSPEGRVFGDMFYKVTNDCACNDRVLDFGNQKWCSPESLAIASATLSLCNKKIVIASDIGRPCVTNWDLREFDLHSADNTIAFKNKHQARYHLMITLQDGTKIDRAYTWRETGVASPGLYSDLDNTSLKTYTQTFTSEIVGLKMELRYGSSTEVVCVWEKSITPPLSHIPAHTTICDPGSNNIKYRFNLAANHIATMVAVGGTIVNGSGYKDIVATQGDMVSVYFTFSDYCPVTVELNEFCCSTLGVAMTVNQVSGNTEITSAVSGGTLPYSVKYYRQVIGGANELAGESTNSLTNFKVILSNPTPGLYFATVSDGSGNCSKNSTIVSIEPRDQTDYSISIIPTFNGCAYTGNVSIGIPNQPDIIGAKVYYKVNSGADIYFTVTNQMVSAGFNLVPATGQTINLVRLEVQNQSGPPTVFLLEGSAAVPSNLNSAIPVLNTFTINGSSSSSNVCAGSNAALAFQGTPNAIVNVSGIAPIPLDGSGYGESIQTPVSTTTYTVTSVTNNAGDCPGTQGVGLTRQASVTPAPVITVVTDVCNGDGTLRTVTFSNITSATDQLGNVLAVSGSSVTVNVDRVTEIHMTYLLGLCTVTYTHFVLPCGAPTITGTVTGPSTVCAGETATITVSGVTGGTAPYSYNYYTSLDYNDVYVLNQTSKSFTLSATDTVYVRVKDALGNISAVGSVLVTVTALATPNVIPIVGQLGVTETSSNVFAINNNIAEAVFKTAASYATYNWSVAGTYAGTTSGGGSTFTISVADITGTIQLTVLVSTENGCIGSETVSISVITAPVLMAADEIVFSTQTYKLYKVQVSPSTVGAPVLLCGSGNPSLGLAFRSSTGQLIGKGSNIGGPALFNLNPLVGCTNSLIGNFSTVAEGTTMLTANKVVGQTTNRLRTYDLSTDIVDTNHYTISDGTNDYSDASALVKIGSALYTSCIRRIAGVFQEYAFLKFTLNGSGGVTAFANVGLTPNQSGSVAGMAYDGTTAYLIFQDGKVYNLNLIAPASSSLIGTILVPSGEGIVDSTNN